MWKEDIKQFSRSKINFSIVSVAEMRKLQNHN